MDQTVKFPFRAQYSVQFPATASATMVEIPLAIANLDPRVVAAASTFEWFRFKKVRAYQFTTLGGVESAAAAWLHGFHALAWIDSNQVLTGVASNVTQMAQYESFKAGGMREKLTVAPRRDQVNAMPLKWYNCASTGTAADTLGDGMFVTLAQSTGILGTPATAQAPLLYVIIEGVIEFRGMITPALSFGAPERPPVEKKDESDSEDGLSGVQVVSGRAAGATYAVTPCVVVPVSKTRVMKSSGK